MLNADVLKGEDQMRTGGGVGKVVFFAVVLYGPPQNEDPAATAIVLRR